MNRRSQAITNRFSFNLSRQLLIKGISQRDLAIKTGIPEANVSRYVNGLRLPKLDTFIIICEALGVKLDDMI